MTARRLIPFAVTALLLSSAQAAPVLTPDQQTRAETLKGTLRCPICSGESIRESSNDISREMRAEVDRMVAEGRSDREVQNYFADRYGQFVLLDPPKEGRNLLLWGGPLLALGLGGWWLGRTLRGSGASPQPGPQEDPDLQPYLAEVQSRRRGGSR